MRRQVFLGLILILACFLLTGCFRGEIWIDIHPDGSADLSYRMMGGEPITNEMKTEAQQNDLVVKDVQEGQMKGIQVNGHFRNAQELSSLKIYDTTLFGRGLIVERGWFSDTYFIDSNIHPQRKNPGEKKDSYSDVYLKLVLNFPSPAEAQNATQVYNEGKTLGWNLLFEKDNPIQVKVKVWKWERIFAAIIGTIIILSGGIYMIYRSKKATGSQETGINNSPKNEVKG